MSNSVSKKLAHVKELINEGKMEEVLQRIEHIEQNKSLTPKESLETRRYKGFIALGLGQLDNALKIAEDLHQKSQKLEMPLYSLDALSIKQWIFFLHLNLEEWYKNYQQSVKLFSSIPREESPEFQQREGHLFSNIAFANYIEGNFDLALDYGNKSLKLIEQVDPHSYLIPKILSQIAQAYGAKGEPKIAI